MEIELKTKESPRLHIDWDINYNCNYRCSYCKTYETGWNNTSFQKAIVAIDALNGSVFTKTKLPITIWFSGGEPSILPWLEDFCLYIKGINPNIYIGMTTNGSQPVDLYSTMLSSHLVDYINFSLHFEFAKPSHFLSKISKLVFKHGLERLSVVVMHESQASQEATEIIESLQSQNIKCSTHLIRDSKYQNSVSSVEYVLKHQDSNIKDIDINGIAHSGNYILALMHHNNYSFKNWRCWAGVNHFYVTKDFELLAASCGIKSFGNLLLDNINYNEDPVICDGRSCICSSNVKIKKIYHR